MTNGLVTSVVSDFNVRTNDDRTLSDQRLVYARRS